MILKVKQNLLLVKQAFFTNLSKKFYRLIFRQISKMYYVTELVREATAELFYWIKCCFQNV